jgi:hypothetical protein
MISLAKFSPLLATSSVSGDNAITDDKNGLDQPNIDFTDEEPSDESSESEAS